jgi:hypothetical protein
MFQIWVKFKRWLRKLLLELAFHMPINWSKKIDELVAIVNAWLDKQQADGPPPPTPSQEPPNRRYIQAWKERFRKLRKLRERHR